MMKTKAEKADRKRTVTLVFGPETEAAMLDYCRVMEGQFPGQSWTLTDVLGVAFRRWVFESIESGVVKLPKSWGSNLK